MKLRRITLASLCLLLAFLSCSDDDEADFVAVPERDREEVYLEDIAEIEEFLQTHFYNYEEFDSSNPYSLANDTFEVVFDTIEGVNSDKIPLIDQVEFKMVEDFEGIEYKLYILNVREGLGDEIHASDRAYVSYIGSIADGTVFDSAVSPTSLSLISVGSQLGTVQGFTEGVIEFKTSDGHTENGDGTLTYHNHGIGAFFIPSGIAYFSSPLPEVESYTPIFFRISLIDRVLSDFDLDNISSYLEDLDGDGDVYSDDTDGDLLANFIDADDDGDGVFTINEDLEPDEDLEVDRDGDGISTNDIGDGNPLNDDTDGDGTPNYLDTDDDGSRLDDEDGDGIPDYLDN